MSAQVTEAHLRLANQLVSSPPSPLVLATLIADSEAKATKQLRAEVERLTAACDKFSNDEITQGDWKSRAERAERELAAEREKVRVLRAACESICEEWGRNHDAPFCAGSNMEKRATAALAATEDAT